MKYIKYFFEFLFSIFFFIFFKIIGPKLSSNISGKIFEIIGPFFRSKNIIQNNIKRALPEIDANNLKNIENSMWNNYGRIFAEYIFLKDFRYGKLASEIQIEGEEILNDIKENNKQVIFISGHLSNFELMAMSIEKSGINLSAIYRPLNNIFLNGIMESIRKKYICKNQIKKGMAGTKEVIGFMKKKHSIALMVDQRLGESDRYPFFNMPAHTTTLPAQLALKFNCNIIPIYLKRVNEGFFEMEILNPINIKKTEVPENDKKSITIQINQIIEDMVRRNPGQWIWTHGRWK